MPWRYKITSNFYITKLDAGYSVRPVDQPTKYLYALNGKLGFTSDTSKALPVTVGEGNPTSNESIDNSASSSVVVIGNAGSVTIQSAQGETAYVRNLLGMPLAETVVISDNATIAVPAGIVLVTVGDETVKVVVKIRHVKGIMKKINRKIIPVRIIKYPTRGEQAGMD